jgi:hypothetical protein
MDTKDLISVRQFCKHHNIPISFLKSLNEIELVEIITTKEELYIQTTQIRRVEKLVRLHYDLDINLEGIHVVYNLLQQVESLQKEVIDLNNRLSFYK